MSGILTEQIKKNDLTKKREKFKLISCLLLSNLFVAALFLIFETKSLPCNAHVITPTINHSHPHYKMVVVPLTLLMDFNPNEQDTRISLLNKNKKVIVKSAFLYEEIKNTNKDNLNPVPRFKIEIPENELINISTDENEVMVAIPEIEEKKKENINIKKQKASIYEVNL